jgi:hypothetical protein
MRYLWRPHQVASLLVAIGATVALVAGACGGNESPLTEEQAKETSENFLLDFFQVIAGREELETLLNYYSPDCQSKFSSREILEAKDSIAGTRLRFPVLRDIHIDELALRDVHYEPSPDGILVFASGVDVVADGERQDLRSYFLKIGLSEATEGSVIRDGLNIVKVRGKAYVDIEPCEADPFKRA